ncbi:MAG: IS66 family insertion sequence element accessory protein TnpA [Planctomycetota bacterium]
MGRRGDGAGKLVEWQRRLARFESWQQTVAAFCAAEQISVPTFYVWKKRLAAGSWSSNPSASLVGAMSPKVPLDATPGVASAIASPDGDVVEVATLTEAANSTTAPASNMPSLQSDTIPRANTRRLRTRSRNAKPERVSVRLRLASSFPAA